MLSLSKRGRTWYAEGRINSERVHESLKTRDVTVARALLRDLELRKLSGGRLVSRRWAAFAPEFLSWVSTTVKSDGADSTFARYKFVVDRFGKFLEARCVLELEHINAEVLAAYSQDRLTDTHTTTKRAVTSNTVRSDFRILHRVFGYAVQSKYLADNPVLWQKPLKGNGEKRPFKPEEIATMLQDHIVAGKPMLRAIILLFTYSGLRISDVIGLRREALDFKASTIVTRTKKRGTTVTLAIHPEVRGALELHRACLTQAQIESPFVFSKADGKPLDRRGLTSILGRMFKRCGIRGAHPHRFRHTFAVRLLEKGASLYDVSRLLGINAATCEEYYAPYVPELRDRAARLIAALSPVSAVTSKVVTISAPLSTTMGHSGEQQANAAEAASAK